MSNRVGIVRDKRFFDHRISSPSPECPERLRHLYLSLDNPAQDQGLVRLPPREASSEQVASIHSPFYLDQLRHHSLEKNPFSYDRDTYLMEESLYTAHLAAGGCLSLADALLADEIDNGFALIRPPGHHAEPGRGMGFCILNNAAITAAYLQKQYGLSRILLFDFDIHHGNGSQEAFYTSDQVLVFSIHQHNLFPFQGNPDELGKEQGKGYTVNVPVFPQFGDQEYTNICGRLLGALVEQYLPQFILVSAGFDGHADDSISDTLLTSSWFATISHMLKSYARSCCDGRLLYILEGGYNPTALEE